MKAFTDSEQSKKLAEILLLESADMGYIPSAEDDDGNTLYTADFKSEFIFDEDCIPCWSLAALIDILPTDWWGFSEHYFLEISKMGDASTPNEVRYFRFRKEIDGANYNRITHISHTAENLVDACVNMIITLHKHKLLNKTK